MILLLVTNKIKAHKTLHSICKKTVLKKQIDFSQAQIVLILYKRVLFCMSISVFLLVF